MKIKNLQLTVLALALCCVTVNAQNAQKAGSKQPVLTNTHNHNGNQETTATRKCGTEIPHGEWDNWTKEQIEELEKINYNIGPYDASKQQAVQYTIPVVFHIVHGGTAVGAGINISQAQVLDQLSILNNDFKSAGFNSGLCPSYFLPVKADAEITFCLATLNPTGGILAEPGIDRRAYTSITGLAAPGAGYSQATVNGTIKPATVWNPLYYCNIWVTALSGGLLGYAVFPVGTSITCITASENATNSGVVNGYQYIGSIGSASLGAPYDRGRTLVHELGHWLGLRHINGDGGCTASDCVTDTPSQEALHGGCPSSASPFHTTNCAGNTPNGEMFMNYMDYTDDACMYMFSVGQKARMQQCMVQGTYRNQLTASASTLCSVPPPIANFTIFPNPICAGQTATITDMSIGSPGAWSYTMTGGSPSTSTLQSPTVTYTAAGVFSITLIASNGSGSSAPVVKTITVNALPIVTITPSSPTICIGGSTTLTASGATTYSWNTGPTTPAIVVSPTVTTTYTVVGFNGTCIGTRTVSVVVGGTPTINITPAGATVCSGSPTTFTGSGATNYTWMPGGITTATISVSPTATTVYTLTGSNGGTCIGTRTVQLTVNTTPTVNVVASPTAICSGSSSTITASGAATYSWNTGATTAAIVVSPTITTNYTVTGTNGTCSNTRTISLVVNSNPTVNVVATPTAICAGNSATITASGAATYSWNTGATTAVIVVNPTVTTNYTVTGSNGSCSNTRTISLIVNPSPPAPTAGSNSPLCAGNTLNLIASNIVGATYNWTGPNSFTSTSQNPNIPGATTLAAGAYSVTATVGGCTGSAGITNVLVNALPSVTINANPVTICPGSSSTLTASGSGPGPFTYFWNTGATTAAITTSNTGVYTATVTNGNGCTGSQSFTLNGSASLTITAIATPTAICAGGSTTITASGASTYTWNTGPTTSSIVVSPTTNTTYTVTGTNGSCTGSTSILIVVSANPTVSIIATPTAVCAGSSSTITASGATTYSWNTGATTAAIAVSPSITTNYTVIGTNTSGCSNTRTISLIVNPSPTVNVVSTPTAICSGNSATIVASGAAAYSWNTGPTTSAIIVNPTITTSYTVTGTNAAGCSNTQTISLVVNTNPTVNVVATPTAICLGSISTLTASGATTYSWNTGATTAAIVVAPISTTNYTVIGFNGTCSNAQTISLIVNPSPTLNITPTSTAICLGTSVTLTGSGALNYTWMPGGITTASVSVSPTVNTTYTLTGTNASGCSGTRTVAVTLLASPVITVTASSLTICTGSSTLTASGSGPPGPFSYLWNTGATTAVITASTGGVYTATFTNGNGCMASQSVTLTVTPGLTITANATPTSVCLGGSTTITATGATTYTWNTGPTTSSIVVSPTVSTNYTVNGTSGGCTGSRTISIAVNPNPTVSVIATPTAICSGSNAALTASGATTYSWNTGATTAVITVSPGVTTTYTVAGTNPAGCSNTGTISLIVNPSPTVNAVASPTAICSGSSATITASGATTYTWNTGPTTSSIVVTPTTTTNYTVTGSNGTCSGTRTISLLVNTTPTVNAVASPTAICVGSTATITASGATTYSWNTGPTTAVVNVTPTITTTYTVTGSNGTCSNTQTISVTVNAAPVVTAFSSATLICVGQSAVLTASGTAISYTWSTGPSTTTISVSPTVTTSYTLTGTGAGGCIVSTVITQSVSGCIGVNTIAAANSSFAVFPNPNNGEFMVTVQQVTENTFVEIFNALGQLVNKQPVKDMTTKINLTEQANGVYLVRIIKDGKQLYRAKVIKD